MQLSVSLNCRFVFCKFDPSGYEWGILAIYRVYVVQMSLMYQKRLVCFLPGQVRYQPAVRGLHRGRVRSEEVTLPHRQKKKKKIVFFAFTVQIFRSLTQLFWFYAYFMCFFAVGLHSRRWIWSREITTRGRLFMWLPLKVTLTLESTHLLYVLIRWFAVCFLWLTLFSLRAVWKPC